LLERRYASWLNGRFMAWIRPVTRGGAVYRDVFKVLYMATSLYWAVSSTSTFVPTVGQKQQRFHARRMDTHKETTFIRHLVPQAGQCGPRKFNRQCLVEKLRGDIASRCVRLIYDVKDTLYVLNWRSRANGESNAHARCARHSASLP